MKLKESVVTVLLPVYNAGKFLPECLESLKEQTYEEIQIIAIDDNSKDDSFSILKKFRREFRNSRSGSERAPRGTRSGSERAPRGTRSGSERALGGIEIYKNKKHYGIAVCYNRAIKLAKGRFIVFMNPNDINAANRFKRQVNFLLKNTKTVAVGTQYTRIDPNNKKIDRSKLPQEHEEIYETLLPSSSLHPETVMIDRKMVPKDLLYFTSNKYPMVFNEIFVKLFQYGKVANITHSLYYYREGIRRYGIHRHSRLKRVTAVIKLWLSSRNNYDYRPSLRSLFPPLLKGI